MTEFDPTALWRPSRPAEAFLYGMPVVPSLAVPVGRMVMTKAPTTIYAHPLDVIALQHQDDHAARLAAASAFLVDQACKLLDLTAEAVTDGGIFDRVLIAENGTGPVPF